MSKKKVNKKNRYFNTLLVIGVLISGLTVLGISYNFNQNQDLRSRASVEDDRNYCVNPPECCTRMEQSHDAHECEWPIRGYCNNCGVIEGRNERCGWYWIWHDKNDNEYQLGTNSPDGYGCMIGDSPSTMRPKYGPGGATNPPPQPTQLPPTATMYILPPTATPIPIPTVFIPPTSFPTVSAPSTVPSPWLLPSPTVFLFPTNIPVNYPTSYVLPTVSVPTLTPTPTPVKFSLPNILPPKEKVDNFIEDVRKRFLRFLSTILP